MANKVQFGICNVHYAVRDENGGWGAPVAMPGAESLTLSNSGSDQTIYADNIAYWKSSAATGKSGDLQMAKFPKEFLTAVLGQKAETGGGISEGPNDVAKEFALLWEISGDKGGRRVCWFNCTATAPTRTDATNTDTVTEGNETSTITATPVNVNGEMKTQYSCEYDDDNYATFFDAVPLVTVAPSA